MAESMKDVARRVLFEDVRFCFPLSSAFPASFSSLLVSALLPLVSSRRLDRLISSPMTLGDWRDGGAQGAGG